MKKSETKTKTQPAPPLGSTSLLALKPFAEYYKRLTDGRKGYPKNGALYALDSGCETEATITIEDLKRCHDLFYANDQREPAN